MNQLITAQFIKSWAEKTPNNTAITSGNKSYSYLWTATSIARLATFLKSKGLQKNSTVVVKINDRMLELISTIALETIGAIRIAQIEDSILAEKCDLCISDHQIKLEKINVLEITPSLIKLIWSDKFDRKDLELLDYTPKPDDLIFISHTSGTTGQKKYFADIYSALWEYFSLMKGIYFANKENAFLCAYPLAVGAAYAGCCLALITGGTIIFTPLNHFLKILDTHPNCHAVLVVKDAMYFYEQHSEIQLKNKIASLRVLGAGLPLDLRLWLEANLADRVYNSYSSNETGQIGEALKNGVVKVYPGVKVKIVDENWNELGFNEKGLITVHSKQLVPGYIWNDDLNSNYFKNGWYRTNDFGYMENNEDLIILDRADNMLIVGGIKIPPIPIENRLKEINGVMDVVLLNATSNLQTEIMACICVAKNTDQSAIERLIIQSLKVILKVNISVYFFDTFPKTETGKVQRFKLIESIK